MTLAAPWALLALVAAAAALWWSLRTERSRPALLMPLERRAETARARAARLLPPALVGAALALLAAALARPQLFEARPPDETGLGVDIMLVLDTSGSMLGVDLEPNRLGAAKKAAAEFVRGRTTDRVGLVVFGGGPMLACPLTADSQALLERLETVRAGMAGDGTALGDGIASGVNHLRQSKAKSRVVILLTDGRGNVGVDAVSAAKAAAAVGVKVYVIGAARRGRTMYPVQTDIGTVMMPLDDDLDVDTLTQVAGLTGGRFWRAESLTQLRDVYAEIDRLERSEVKLPASALRVDVYRPLVIAALLLLALEGALSQTVLLRWP